MNSVTFRPWCKETLNSAAKADLPLLIFVGCAASSGCVPEDLKLFKNSRIKDVINSSFIPVMIDKDLQPDAAAVYMNVCAALNGSAGCPLYAIAFSDGRPFFNAALPSKPELYAKLLTAAYTKWKTSRDELYKIASDIIKNVSASALQDAPAPADNLPAAAAKQLTLSYDSEHGGFGSAPKFSSAHGLIFLLRYAAVCGEPEARKPAVHTLQQMYRGGFFDHFGGGFFHYSTDREWLAPHFEKYLSDNAMLACAYIEAWKAGHFALYRNTAEAVLRFCLRDMKSAAGGYITALCSDVGGEVGEQYLFTPADVCSILGEDAGRHFCSCYDITEEGNINKKSIPNLLLNNRWNMVPEGYAEYCERLRSFRNIRSPRKSVNAVMAGSNALMLSALSNACSSFGSFNYLKEAHELANVLAALYDGEKLYAGVGCSSIATLRDYSFYANSLLDLYAADYDCTHIVTAERLAENITEHFLAPSGGLYDTADFAERLAFRTQTVYDDELPSGNCSAAVLFGRLARLTGKARWKQAAARQQAFFSAKAGKYPAGCAWALCETMIETSKTIVCVCPDEDIPEQLDAVTARYAPELSVIVKTPANAEVLSAAVPFTSGMTVSSSPSFYICSKDSISGPIRL